MDKDEVLGTFTYQIDSFTSLKEYRVPLNKENQYLKFSMELKRLVKMKEICYLDFSEDFNKKGIVRDITGKLNNFNVKTIEGRPPKIGDGLDYESYGVNLLGKNYLESVENFMNSLFEFSISIWFRMEETKDCPLISTTELSFEVFCFKSMFYDSQGNIFAETSPDEFKEKYLEKEWNFKVITFSGTHIREYLNGHLINDLLLKKSTSIEMSQTLLIGGRFSKNGNFEGYIGDITKVHFYDYILSPEEIKKKFKK